MANRFSSSSAFHFVASGQQGGQPQNVELAAALQDICEKCEKALAVRARDAQTYAAWGSALLQLAFICNEHSKKMEYLKVSREKLSRAVDINAKVTTPDKILGVLELGNALYITYLLESDAAIACNFLEKCRAAYRKGQKLDPKPSEELTAQLDNAESKRAEVQAMIRRFHGKSEEERAAEFGAVVRERVNIAAAEAEASPESAKALFTYAQALVDYSLVQADKWLRANPSERGNEADSVDQARDSIIKAVELLSKSVSIEGTKDAYALLALGLNALGMCNTVAAHADALFREARGAFSCAITATEDKQEAAAMLLQLKDMYQSGEKWCSVNPQGGGEGVFEAVPKELVKLTGTSSSPPATSKQAPASEAKTDRRTKSVKSESGTVAAAAGKFPLTPADAATGDIARPGGVKASRPSLHTPQTHDHVRPSTSPTTPGELQHSGGIIATQPARKRQAQGHAANDTGMAASEGVAAEDGRIAEREQDAAADLAGTVPSNGTSSSSSSKKKKKKKKAKALTAKRTVEQDASPAFSRSPYILALVTTVAVGVGVLAAWRSRARWLQWRGAD